MLKGVLITVIFLVISIFGIAQPIDHNSAIVKKYGNDSLGFVSYPEVSLLENLKLPAKYSELEINTLFSVYHPGKPKYQYQNLFRYPKLAQQLADTDVLSKCDLLKCFASCWCPDFSPWYISAKSVGGHIETIGDTTSMKKFLGDAKNKFNAYLYIQAYGYLIRYQQIPLTTSKGFKYKKVADGWLLTYNTIDGSEAWTTTVDLTYLIGPDFKITLVAKRNHVRSMVNFKI